MHSSSVRYAGFWRRWVAFGVDGVFASFVTIIIRVALGVSPFDTVISPQSVFHYLGARTLVPYLGALLSIAGIWALTNGRSPGKWLMGIRIVRADGKRLSMGTALLRYVAYALSGFFFSLGYLWMLWDANRQTWHDKVAKTYVVLDPVRNPGTLSWSIGIGFPALVYILYFWILAVSQGVAVVPGDLLARYRDMQSLRAKMALPAAARTHIGKADALLGTLTDIPATDSARLRESAREAVEELKLARDAAPDSGIVYVKLATAYLWLDGGPAKEKALENAQNAYREDPNDRVAVYVLGRALYNLGRFGDAAAMFEKAVSLDHTYKVAYQSLGYTYRELKQYARARANFVSAIELYTKANTNGQYDETLRVLHQAMGGLPYAP